MIKFFLITTKDFKNQSHRWLCPLFKHVRNVERMSEGSNHLSRFRFCRWFTPHSHTENLFPLQFSAFACSDFFMICFDVCNMSHTSAYVFTSAHTHIEMVNLAQVISPEMWSQMVFICHCPHSINSVEMLWDD